MNIQIAKTMRGAKARLAQIEQAERLTGWERAAIVWAHTGRSRGRPHEEEGNGADAPFSHEEMGKQLGVSRDTIKRARKAWAWAMEHANAPDVQPGESVTLPTIKYPPIEEPGARGERGLKATLKEDPGALKEIIETDAEVAEIVVEAVAASTELTSAVLERRVGVERGEFHPAMHEMPANHDKELAEAIYTIGTKLRLERDGLWTPDGISESMLRLLGISLNDRHAKAVPDIFDQIDAHLASTKSRK